MKSKEKNSSIWQSYKLGKSDQYYSYNNLLSKITIRGYSK